MKKRFNYTFGALIGSSICLLWLPFIQAASIFVAVTIANLTVDFINYAFNDKTPKP